MTTLRCARSLYEEATGHLETRPEQVGFFLAQFHDASRCFQLTDWQPINGDGYEHQGDYHVRLSDDTQTQVIQWATRERACLVEAHSHGELVPAGFSSSDLYGFDEWVPHCSWRLQRRPYAALVTARDGFDALAWIDGPGRREQVHDLELDDGSDLHASGWTMRSCNFGQLDV